MDSLWFSEKRVLKLSGWIDIADQIEKADRKGKKKHGEVF